MVVDVLEVEDELTPASPMLSVVSLEVVFLAVEEDEEGTKADQGMTVVLALAGVEAAVQASSVSTRGKVATSLMSVLCCRRQNGERGNRAAYQRRWWSSS